MMRVGMMNEGMLLRMKEMAVFTPVDVFFSTCFFLCV